MMDINYIWYVMIALLIGVVIYLITGSIFLASIPYVICGLLIVIIETKFYFRFLKNRKEEKRMKKKILGIPMVLFIVGILLIGGVSAGLLTYFGRITAIATVTQSVLVDGAPYSSTAITETKSGVAGTTLNGDDHTLEDMSDDWIIVEPIFVKSGPAEDDPDGDGVTPYIEHKLVSTSGGEVNVGDEDDVHLYLGSSGSVLWSAFVNASFDYNITEGSTRVPHVNAWLRKTGEDDVQITTWNGGSPAGDDGDDTATYTKAMFVKTNGASVATDYEDYSIREVRIQSGDPSSDPTGADDDQTVYVSHIQVNDGNDLTQIELPVQSYANIPGRIVGFRVEYEFSNEAYAGEYTVITNIDYIGEISESGVTIDGVVY